MTGERAYAVEQRKIGCLWTLLCLESDIPRDGDWVTADLGGISVFVQRFGDRLAAFENVCAHRFFPLRIGKRGNGSLRCGFHGWKYDETGLAVDIPRCQDLFGCAPAQMEARLRPVETGVCGALVFGRLRSAQDSPALIDYLGDLAPILRTMTEGCAQSIRFERSVAADWKINCRVALDDYHIVSVHPDTFGAKGALRQGTYRYYRRDPHSALFVPPGGDQKSFDEMARACAEGRYRPSGYRVFYIFPNLNVLHIRFWGRWYIVVIQFPPLAAERSVVRSWLFAARMVPPAPYDWLIEPWRRFVVSRLVAKILGEDAVVGEKLQSVAHQAGSAPIFSPQEERVTWFEESYARFMTGDGGWALPVAASLSCGPEQLPETGSG
jgi:phenylpropionate dioxygenase-like ring-hydroxylating dioxygenase large terminal subunit